MANIEQYSEQFLPSFAIVQLPRDDQMQRYYQPLDFAYDYRGARPVAGETVLARWMTISAVMITVTDTGMPIGVTGDFSGSLHKLFDGMCSITLTDRRLMLHVSDGQTLLGKMGGGTGRLLIAVFPLGRVDSVGVDLQQGSRGPKERGLTILAMAGPVAVLAVHDVGMVWGNGQFTRFRGSLGDVLDQLVAPIVAVRRLHAVGADLAQLDDVLGGARERTQSEIAAVFVVDKGSGAPDALPARHLSRTLERGGEAVVQPSTAERVSEAGVALGTRFCTRAGCPLQGVRTEKSQCPDCALQTRTIHGYAGLTKVVEPPQQIAQRGLHTGGIASPPAQTEHGNSSERPAFVPGNPYLPVDQGAGPRGSRHTTKHGTFDKGLAVGYISIYGLLLILSIYVTLNTNIGFWGVAGIAAFGWMIWRECEVFRTGKR